MKSLRIFPAVALIGCLAFSHNISAAIDPAASVVLLRTSCDDGAGGTLNNCFTSLGDLNTWVVTRNPSPTNALRIEVGPGSYNAGFKCTNVGGISIEGAGRGVTTFGQTSGAVGMVLSNCSRLSVSHITIKGGYGAVQWGGDGVTTWTDVEVIGAGRGWYETAGCTQSQSKHYWNSSHIEAIPFFSLVDPYDSNCGEHWFFGSELVANGIQSGLPGGYPGDVVAVRAYGTAEIHVYGSVLRALVSTTAAYGTPATGAAAVGGQVHIHGTGIDVISSVPRDIWALHAEAGGMIHANASAYNLSTTSGTVTRISNAGGHIHAPYLWEHIPDPTTMPNFTSVTGADMTTVTTGTSDGHPHFVIYDSSCVSKWYDTVDKVCRP
jgi:hypothetical protein